MKRPLIRGSGGPLNEFGLRMVCDSMFKGETRVLGFIFVITS